MERTDEDVAFYSIEMNTFANMTKIKQTKKKACLPLKWGSLQVF